MTAFWANLACATYGIFKLSCFWTTWFLDLDDLARINRARPYKDFKVNGELAQTEGMLNLKGKVLRSFPTGGNILLLDSSDAIIGIVANV